MTVLLRPMCELYVVENKINILEAGKDPKNLVPLITHVTQHEAMLLPEKTQRHRIGLETSLGKLEKAPVPRWREVEAPRVCLPGKMIDVINEHNRLNDGNGVGGERSPIYAKVTGRNFAGGWGYEPDGYCEILFDWTNYNVKECKGVSLEMLFLERRIYEELLIDRSVGKPDMNCIRWGIDKVTVYAAGDHVIDRIDYTVTGFSFEDQFALQEDIRRHNGYAGDVEGALMHLEHANRLRVGYRQSCWFDATRFYRKPERMPETTDCGSRADEKLGLVFPAYLGKAKLTTTHQYETEKLGYSMRYVAGPIVCDIYVYTDGEQDLFDIRAEKVQTHFRSVTELIKSTKHVVGEKAASLFRLPKSNLLYWCASFQVREPQFPDPFLSVVWLTVFKGHYVKLRCTSILQGSESMSEDFDTLVSALDGLLAQAK